MAGSMFVWNSSAPEPDVKEMVDQNAAQFQAMNARLALQMWGLKVYERDESTAHDPSQWRQRLREAHVICTRANDMGRDGPGSWPPSASATTGRRCRMMIGSGV